MANGYLQTQVFLETLEAPMIGAVVRIVGPDSTEHNCKTNSFGKTDFVVLAVPEKQLSEVPTPSCDAYTLYQVYVSMDGYRTVKVTDVKVFPEVETMLPIRLSSMDRIVESTTWGMPDHSRMSKTECMKPPAAPSSLVPEVHTVKAGETLYTIAAKYGTSVREIKELNHLISDDLAVGQILWIPSYEVPAPSYSPPPMPTPDCNGTSYTVKAGDSLWTIAQKYGVEVAAIKYASGISSDNIYVGQMLCIPKGHSPSPTFDCNGTVYIVKAGDSLWTIAQRYGVEVDAIKCASEISIDSISIGQKLCIPKCHSPSPTPHCNGTSYTVKSGDSLWTIAQRYGVEVDAIKHASGISSDNISVGQILCIPKCHLPSPIPHCNGTTYIVKADDNLWLIAQRYNTTVESIKEKNGISSNYLTIGQMLCI